GCLRQEQRYPAQPAASLAGGRLVLFAPDESLFDGAAEDATRGFFDVNNMPGWDTWICYLEDTQRIAEHRQQWLAAGAPTAYPPVDYDAYLVSWVPPRLLDLVSTGIDVNPEGCITWADDVATAFTGRLRALGLL